MKHALCCGLNAAIVLKYGGWPDIASGAPLPQYQVGEFSQVDTPLGRDGELSFRTRGNDERELTFAPS